MKLGEVLKTYRLSKAVQGVLVNAPSSPPSDHDTAPIDIRAYLMSAYRAGEDS